MVESGLNLSSFNGKLNLTWFFIGFSFKAKSLKLFMSDL